MFSQLLFVDIETVPMEENYQSLSGEWQDLWEQKMDYKLKRDEQTSAESLWEKAGIYAEFGRIVCVSWAFFDLDNTTNRMLHLNSSCGEDESKILEMTIQQWEKIKTKYPRTAFAGHNIQEFDLPFLCRRMLAQRIAIPNFLPSQGAKPWEFKCLDTMKWWRFGDYKNYTSLDLIAHVLGIPSSKGELDGSMVANYFYQCKDIESIQRYCNRDVILTARVAMHYLNLPALQDDEIHYINA